jgi:hypothetical protein
LESGLSDKHGKAKSTYTSGRRIETVGLEEGGVQKQSMKRLIKTNTYINTREYKDRNKHTNTNTNQHNTDNPAAGKHGKPKVIAAGVVHER